MEIYKKDVDLNMKISEIAQRLKISESSIKEKNGRYIVFHTPFCVKGNEMFDENNYLNIECDFELLLEHQIEFKKCKFVKPMILNFKTVEKSIFFYDCIFGEDFKIKDSTICEEITILHSRFKKDFYLSTSKCQEDTRLRQCTFYGNVDCHNSIFEKILDLYASEVLGIPNFVGCVNKSKVDLLGFTSQIQFQLLEKYIKTQQQIYKNNYIDDWEYKNFEYLPALEVQDTFRFFKDILLKEGSVLKSSNYHRVELYCKELELDSKPQKSWRDRIDSLQLWFYRHLCDHHTDLLRVWNSLMYLIFIFGVLSFGAMAWFAYYFDNNFSLANCFDSTHLRVFYDSHIKFMIHKHPLRIWGINLGFIALFLFLLLGLTSKICRRIFIIPSYLVSIGMFAISPKLLMPAIGFFTDKREILDPLSIIGGFYTLLFGLIAYSLIKTARKNSIISS